MKKILAVVFSLLIGVCSLGLTACDAQANDDAKFTITTIYNLLREEGFDGTVAELTEIFQGKDISSFEISADGRLFVIYEDGSIQQVGGHNLILDFVLKKPICGQKGYGYYECVGHCNQSILAIIDSAYETHDFQENGFCAQCVSYIDEIAVRKVCDNAYFLAGNDGFFDLYLVGEGAVSLAGNLSVAEAKCVKGLFISKDITDLGAETFETFINLESIIVDEENANYYSTENSLYNKLTDELIKACVVEDGTNPESDIVE